MVTSIFTHLKIRVAISPRFAASTFWKGISPELNQRLPVEAMLLCMSCLERSFMIT